MTSKRACVVVLGDIGRSPRMQYHALSLTRNKFIVDIVGYGGSQIHEELANSSLIHCHHMKNVPALEKWFPRLIVYMLKTCWQSLFLLITLLSIPRPRVMILQNPPSIPTLPICWFACKLRQCKLVIDFHNYGFTILSLSISKTNLLVKICAWCEKLFGRKADLNFCVTKAMKEDLAKNWNVRANVFYDTAPEIFHPISLEEKHNLFKKLGEQYKEFSGRADSDDSTKFSKRIEGNISLLEDRPALIVSSTSWTEDEDFSILLDSLVEYDEVADQNSLPDVVVAITGKGPLKEMYESLIKAAHLKHVQIVTMWLAAEDYPTFLASADFGVSLHKSSSGLDLPMKVVDMFGSGIPVCSYSYPCINELVKDGVNGVLFSSSQELSNHFKNLLEGFPTRAERLEKYRINLTETPRVKWDQNWNEHVLPLVLETIS